MGVDGIDLEYGITNSNIEEAVLNKKMIEASLRTIILADSSKFGRRGFGKICSLDCIDVIITDSGISQSMAQAIEEGHRTYHCLKQLYHPKNYPTKVIFRKL